MKIGVLGSGTVGQTLASGFLKHGHQVMLGTRQPQKPEAQKWLGANPTGRVGTFEEAARFADLAVLATQGLAAESALELAGIGNLAGKTIIDATNPIADAPPVDGFLQYFTGPNESLGEIVQKKAPTSNVVKAFNSVGSGLMVNPHFEQGPPTMFICGNEPDAKQQVAEIVKQFGWEPYDVGAIKAARALEELCRIWCAPGFLRNDWTHAFKMLAR